MRGETQGGTSSNHIYDLFDIIIKRIEKIENRLTKLEEFKMKKNKPEWKCRRCNEICFKEDILTAPNPFEPETILLGCPACKEINSFELLCDERGCVETLNNASPFPTKEGQRRICDAHLRALKQPSGNTG
jgi:Zn finger protein HypA/HybF involved in hydrogenase expression